MADASSVVALASGGVVAIGILSTALLRGWNDWLELRQLELQSGRKSGGAPDVQIANLRERVRRLEAIANGTER